MRDALPADHDDDDGCTVGRFAARAGYGRGQRTAAAVGHHNRRRSYPQPALDALYHTGGVCIPRPVESLDTAPSRGEHEPERTALGTRERRLCALRNFVTYPLPNMARRSV